MTTAEGAGAAPPLPVDPSLSVGDEISAANGRWNFGGAVSETFDAHVGRSVPFYDEGHDLVAKLSDFFLQEGSTCYELGCSTGRLTEMLGSRNADRDVSIVGIDIVPEMTDKARERCAHLPNVEIVTDDLVDVDLRPADLIVAYYTLQFVRPKNRQLVIDRLYQALNWGGALVLFEKVRGPDARFQDIATALYTDFKLDQGFEPDEIVGKARSLKGVLEPFSTQGNIDMLTRAGFVDVTTVMKYVCFEGFLAVK